MVVIQVQSGQRPQTTEVVSVDLFELVVAELEHLNENSGGVYYCGMRFGSFCYSKAETHCRKSFFTVGHCSLQVWFGQCQTDKLTLYMVIIMLK